MACLDDAMEATKREVLWPLIATMNKAENAFGFHKDRNRYELDDVERLELLMTALDICLKPEVSAPSEQEKHVIAAVEAMPPLVRNMGQSLYKCLTQDVRLPSDYEVVSLMRNAFLQAQLREAAEAAQGGALSQWAGVPLSDSVFELVSRGTAQFEPADVAALQDSIGAYASWFAGEVARVSCGRARGGLRVPPPNLAACSGNETEEELADQLEFLAEFGSKYFPAKPPPVDAVSLRVLKHNSTLSYYIGGGVRVPPPKLDPTSHRHWGRSLEQLMFFTDEELEDEDPMAEEASAPTEERSHGHVAPSQTVARGAGRSQRQAAISQPPKLCALHRAPLAEPQERMYVPSSRFYAEIGLIEPDAVTADAPGSDEATLLDPEMGAAIQVAALRARVGAAKSDATASRADDAPQPAAPQPAAPQPAQPGLARAPAPPEASARVRMAPVRTASERQAPEATEVDQMLKKLHFEDVMNAIEACEGEIENTRARMGWVHTLQMWLPRVARAGAREKHEQSVLDQTWEQAALGVTKNRARAIAMTHAVKVDMTHVAFRKEQRRLEKKEQITIAKKKEAAAKEEAAKQAATAAAPEGGAQQQVGTAAAKAVAGASAGAAQAPPMSKREAALAARQHRLQPYGKEKLQQEALEQKALNEMTIKTEPTHGRFLKPSAKVAPEAGGATVEPPRAAPASADPPPKAFVPAAAPAAVPAAAPAAAPAAVAAAAPAAVPAAAPAAVAGDRSCGLNSSHSMRKCYMRVAPVLAQASRPSAASHYTRYAADPPSDPSGAAAAADRAPSRPHRPHPGGRPHPADRPQTANPRPQTANLTYTHHGREHQSSDGEAGRHNVTTRHAHEDEEAKAEAAVLRRAIGAKAKKLSLKDATRLHEAGVSAEHRAVQMRAAGYDATEMYETGFTTSELAHAGFSTAELREAGCPVAELKAAGHTVEDMNTAGYSAADLLGAGFSLARLHAIGCTLAELRKGGAKASALRPFVNSVEELVEAGFSPNELAEDSVGLSQAEIKHLDALGDTYPC